MRLPRGIRNNNPGNLRRSPGWQMWKGIAAEQKDPEFITFESPEYGIRAIAKTLLTYQNVHKLHTVAKIIGRWAPPVENDTGAYVAAVAKHLKVGANDRIDVTDKATMLGLVTAIIRHENGRNPYTLEQLHGGLELAGIKRG